MLSDNVGSFNAVENRLSATECCLACEGAETNIDSFFENVYAKLCCFPRRCSCARCMCADVACSKCWTHKRELRDVWTEDGDEIKAFFLTSLRARFPDIVSEENVGSWRDCHTEIWLTELRCPKYNSILRGEK